MPDESVSRTSTIAIVNRTDTRPAPRREATHDLDVRKALRSVAGMAAGQSVTPGRPDSDAAWADGQRQTRWSDWGLVVVGGGMGIVALIVLVLSVLTVSDDSTHRPAPSRSSVAPSATAPSPTEVVPSPTAAVPAPSIAPPPMPAPSIAPPPMPATPTQSAQPAETAPNEIAPRPRPTWVGPRRLHQLFPYLVPAD
jgi:hypothetical protein